MPAPFRAHVSVWQRLLDHLFFPVNMWLSEEASHGLRLTPIDHERVRIVLPYCRGRLLDVACGNNLLVRTYGDGVGVDLYSYPEINVRCESCRLPFKDSTFDSVALLACLNHITRRRETLQECRRVLRQQGLLLITMIPTWVGFFSHKIRRRHDPDQVERGMAYGEELGLSSRTLRLLLEGVGFKLMVHRRFLWCLNNLYVGLKN